MKTFLAFFRFELRHKDPYWLEQWPYLKADPIRWLVQAYRNWRARPELHRMLDERMSQWTIVRRPGETDAELRARLKGTGGHGGPEVKR